MKRKYFYKYTLLALLISSLSAQAANVCTKSSSRDLDISCDIEETEMYIGASFGHVQPVAKSFNLSAGSSSTGSLGVLIGKRFNDTYAFEAGFFQAGALYDAASANMTDVNVYSFTGLGRLPLDSGHHLSAFGKFGWGISYVTIQQVGSNWHGDLTYGAGLDISLSGSRNWFLRVGIDEYNTGALSVLVPGQAVPRDKLDNYYGTLFINF